MVEIKKFARDFRKICFLKVILKKNYRYTYTNISFTINTVNCYFEIILMCMTNKMNK